MINGKQIAFQLLLIISLVQVSSITQSDESQQETKRTGYPVVTGGFANASAQFFIADTGCETCLADKGWASINLTEYDRFRNSFTSLSGTTRLDFLRQVPVRINHMEGKNLDIGVVDFAALSSFADRRLDGVIGMPYLKDYVFKYSATDGCLLLEEVPDLGPSVVVVPLRITRILPEIQVNLPGIGKRWVLIDTGSNVGLTLHSKRLNLLERMGHVSATNKSVAIDAQGKYVGSDGYVARWLEIGEIKFQNIAVEESPIESIGLGLLHNFTMVLDFSGSRAYLKFNGADNVCSQTRNASGMAVNNKTNGRLGVLKIRDGSPAAELGLQVGDEITDIDKKKPESLSYWEVLDVLGAAGKTIPLTVIRDGKVIELKMPLRHTIPFPPDWSPEKPEFNPEP